ncbi:hypothetical protein [Belnapia rosea]|uniref:Uncharacterized protein n=1 Tax=Belnapia rosea TaxID=938405 RepID=A0A1G7BUX8_9PROT|nr:hypothetical protein [Belnapia rosea]SDE30813.1 hypothetical protein SAMN04487779_102733 [Belnapia rosea]
MMQQTETFDELLKEYEARLELTMHGFEQRHVIIAELPDGSSIVVRGQRYRLNHKDASQLSACSINVPTEIAAKALQQALLKVQEPPAPNAFRRTSGRRP